jgi:hypothetical protein
MTRPHREPCGCASTDRQWTTWCEQHRAEHEATRTRWHEEHVQRVSASLRAFAQAMRGDTP